MPARSAEAGAKVRPEYEAFLELREKEATQGECIPSWNVTRRTSSPTCSSMTTTIRIAQSLRWTSPAYEYYLADGEQVKTSKAKFFAVDDSTRLCGVCEEAATLAIERSRGAFG